MLHFLDKIKTTHGSAEKCVINLKLLSVEDVNRLKSNTSVVETQ